MLSEASDFSLYDRYESNVRSYCRNVPLHFTRAKNSTLHTSDGRSYIDFLSGCGSLNYGHNDDDLKAALIEHISQDGLAHSLDLHTQAKGAFIRTFVDLILKPRGLDFKIQFTGPTGTNAVEAALKLARKVTGRANVIAFTNGFHGVSLGALASTGNKYSRQAAGCGLSNVMRLPYEGYLGEEIDTVDMLERMLADPSSGVDDPAAIIVELVQGEGGLNMVSKDWIQRLRKIATRYGALLIVDDVQAGCGRTGTFFSFEPLDVVPDIIVMAKSLSGFGLPMAAVLMRRDFDKWSPGEHTGTFRGNNHAFVTATAAVRKFWSDASFSRDLKAKSSIVRAALDQIAERCGWQVRGRGMMCGLLTPTGAIAEKVRLQALERGVILENCGPSDEVIKIFPPLTIEDHLLRKGLARLSDAALATSDRSPSAELHMAE